MTRTAIVHSCKMKMEAFLRARSAGRTPKFSTRVYNRCHLCDRRHGFMRYFGICRICFRELACEGLIPGVTKSSW